MKTVFLLNLKSASKDVYLLFWSIVLPIAILILLRIFIPDHSEYAASGIMATSVFFYAFMSTAFISLSHRRRGVYNLLHATPMPLYKYILGISGSWSLISLGLGYLILFSGMAFSHISLSIAGFLMTLPVVLTGAFAFIFLSFTVSSLVKTEGHLSITTNLVMFPMLLCSSAFYSMEAAPAFIQFVSVINPFEWFVSGIRDSLMAEISPWVQSLSVLLIFFILFLSFSLKTFKYSQ